MIGSLIEGMLVRYPDKSIWYVDHVNPSGAYVIPITGYRTKIITSKRFGRKEAEVIKYGRPMIISANSALEILDWSTFNRADIMRRVMARKDGNEGTAVLDAGAQLESGSGTKERAPRTQQKYLRTNKEAKDMKGQGRVILDHLNATTTPQTVSEVTAAVKGGISTKQDPERVVGYYLTRFKKDGLVNVVKEGE